MNNKNNFLKRYTSLPDTKGTRNFIGAGVALVSIMNPCMLVLFNKQGYHIESQILKYLFIISVIVFDLFSLIFYIMPNKLKKATYLYTAIAFIGSSIFYMFIAINIILNEIDGSSSYIIIFIALLIYGSIVLAVIVNIKNKIRSNYNKKPNEKLIVIISSLGVAVGMIAAKKIDLDGTNLAIMLMVLAYALIPTISGFHKFHLIMKS